MISKKITPMKFQTHDSVPKKRIIQESGEGLGLKGGHGRNKGGVYGPGGFCICAKCNTKVPHKTGMKCTDSKCPECGHTMIREELLVEKRNKIREKL
ncbi:MAG: hypothetical protein M0Q41_08405 [Bacteroidales bacterium]|nr:hypothetical protein [Bacteroidales bacterium]